MSKLKPYASRLENNSTGWLLVMFAAMLWGTDVLLRPRVLRGGIDAVSVVLYEHIALTLIFFPTVVKNWNSLRLNRNELVGLLFIAGAGSTLGTVLLTRAYQVGDPLTATLLQKLQPGFAVAAASFFLKERQKLQFWPWFGLALVGAYLISFGFTAIGSPNNQRSLYAAIYAGSAAGLWGCCTVVGRWTLNRLEPLPVAGLRFAFALPILLGWSLIGGHSMPSPELWHRAVLFPLLLIVLLPDALGMSLYYFGLRRTTASLATLAELAYPVTAMVLAYGSTERFQVAQWVGIGLLLLSLYFIRKLNLVQASVAPSPVVT